MTQRSSSGHSSVATAWLLVLAAKSPTGGHVSSAYAAVLALRMQAAPMALSVA